MYENVELHNVAETPPMRGGGVRLQRVPEPVREALNDGAKMRVRQPDGCEIRFVADGPARVTLSSLGSTEAVVFFGTFEGRISRTVGRDQTVLEIEPTDRLKNLAEGYAQDLPFSPGVVRILLGGVIRTIEIPSSFMVSKAARSGLPTPPSCRICDISPTEPPSPMGSMPMPPT